MHLYTYSLLYKAFLKTKGMHAPSIKKHTHYRPQTTPKAPPILSLPNTQHNNLDVSQQTWVPRCTSNSNTKKKTKIVWVTSGFGHILRYRSQSPASARISVIGQNLRDQHQQTCFTRRFCPLPSILSSSVDWDLSRRMWPHPSIVSWWCPSVNFFKFQPCDHTPPGTQRLMISHKVLTETKRNSANPLSA